jgi:cystathionine beta-synthase
VGEAVALMLKEGISQLPVVDETGHFTGSLSESKLLHRLIENPELRQTAIHEVMDPPFKFVGMDNTLDVLSSLLDKENKALLVRDENNQVHIITQADLLMALAK